MSVLKTEIIYFQWKQATKDIQYKEIQEKLKQTETTISNILKQNNRLQFQVSEFLHYFSRFLVKRFIPLVKKCQRMQYS